VHAPPVQIDAGGGAAAAGGAALTSHEPAPSTATDSNNRVRTTR